jgi:threonine dehydrogenase-like Zn-dependent dehydrogenase
MVVAAPGRRAGVWRRRCDFGGAPRVDYARATDESAPRRRVRLRAARGRLRVGPRARPRVGLRQLPRLPAPSRPRPSSQTATFGDLAAQIGNIDLVYEAVGHSHFALQALRVLGTNGIFVLTGVPGLQAFVEADPAHLMREMVLKNQMLLGTVNAGREAFASALRDLDAFRRRWPAVVRTLIAGRYPPEQAPDLILGRPAGIKSVITFDPAVAGQSSGPR